MEEQKEWVRHVLVVGVRNNVAEVMEHYRVVTETQGQSASPLIALLRPRGHMNDTNFTLTAHAQTIRSIKTLHHTNNKITLNSSSGTSKQHNYPGPAAQPPAPTSLTAIRQKKDIRPPRPLHLRTLSDMIKWELNIT